MILTVVPLRPGLPHEVSFSLISLTSTPLVLAISSKYLFQSAKDSFGAFLKQKTSQAVRVKFSVLPPRPGGNDKPSRKALFDISKVVSKLGKTIQPRLAFAWPSSCHICKCIEIEINNAWPDPRDLSDSQYTRRQGIFDHGFSYRT